MNVFLLFQNVPPDLSICTFVLEQSLSVRALQEMLASSEDKAEGVSVKTHSTHTDRQQGVNVQQVDVRSGLIHQRDETYKGKDGLHGQIETLFPHCSLLSEVISTPLYVRSLALTHDTRRLLICPHPGAEFLHSINIVFPNRSSVWVIESCPDHLCAL